jgi:hypothetical protein
VTIRISPRSYFALISESVWSRCDDWRKQCVLDQLATEECVPLTVDEGLSVVIESGVVEAQGAGAFLVLVR